MKKPFLKKSRLFRYEPEFIFRYLCLKPYNAAIHTILPYPDAGETGEFFLSGKAPG
jgi:hypothetical protein